ncbi:spermidine/putrescine ABC transporter permease [Spiroplasma endosymbiont of Othius punctulatus]|uniref:spermidine/putrescine ABC transporter permease n=1 Tax=Spiroplasma endosymbiont of Othius punctulatus TaxID=3066289 RepID=UPI0030D08AF3
MNTNDQMNTEENVLTEQVVPTTTQTPIKKTRKEKFNAFLEKRMTKKVWPILVPFFIVMIFLIVIPIISVVVYSIIEPTGNITIFKFNLDNFIKFVTTTSLVWMLALSILLALAASLISILIAYPMAYILSTLKSKFMARNIWLLVTMPIWVNMILKSIGLQSFFHLIGGNMLGTQFAVIVGMVYMFLPFAVAPIYNALEGQDPIYVQASLDLKASKWRAFREITLRHSMPGVITAFSLVLIQSATSLLIVRYMGDGKITLITSIIESYFTQGTNFGFGAAISIVLAITIFIIILLSNLLSKKFEEGKKKKWKDSFNQVI